MANSIFVIMVQGDRAPALLGPMSPEMRTDIMQDLQTRYGPTCGLHAMDIETDGPERVSVNVKRYEPKGAQA
jgi:hypothetical protein